MVGRKTNLKAVCGALVTLVGLAVIWKLVHSGWEQTAFYALLNALSISCMGLGTLLLLPVIVRLNIEKTWLHRCLVQISLYLYTLYLSHFPLLFLVKAAFGLHKDSPTTMLLLAIVLWLSLVWVCSAVIFHFFEKPVSDLRERFTQRVDTPLFLSAGSHE